MQFNMNETLEIGTVKTVIESIYVPMVMSQLDIDKMNMDGMFIAGGLFASMLAGDKIKDIDVFILDNSVLKSFIVDRVTLNLGYSKSDVTYLGNPNIQDVFVQRRAEIPVQFILTKYKTREELVNHFDYKHCCVSYDIKLNKLHISPYSYDCIKNKKLVVNNGTNIQHWREQKFLKRGFQKAAI